MFKRILTILFIFVPVFSLTGQIPRLYTSEQGLTTTRINDICQDSAGFVYISTENGLVRFDGMDFQSINTDSRLSGSLTSSLVLTVFEDSRSVLWTGTTKGLLTLDDKDGKFSKIVLGDSDLPDSDPHISDIIEVPLSDGASEIWAASSQYGIYVLDGNTRTPVMSKREKVNNSLGNKFIFKLFEDSRGKIWVASETGGLCVLDGHSGERIFDVFFSRSDWKLADDVLVRDIKEDESTSDIILATSNYGILVYDAVTHTINRSSSPAARSCAAMSLLRYRKSGEEQKYLVGTEDHGLKLYDLRHDTMEDFHPEGTDVDISDWKIHSLMEDRQGNIWVGAYRSGILVIPNSMYGFRHLSVNDSGSGHSGSVSSIQRDLRDRSLWVGTDGRGLVRLYADGRKRYFNSSNSAFTNDAVMSLAFDRRWTLWAATYQGGLFRVSNDTVSEYEGNADLGTSKIVHLAYDFRKDLLYVGTYGGGLSILDAATGTVVKKLTDDRLMWVSALYLDGAGTLWIGSFNGPARYSPDRDELVFCNGADGDLRSRVYCFCEGDSATMWIGTGEGLVSYDQIVDEYSVFTQKDGLTSEVICGLLKSDDGAIWASTSNGLSRLDPSSGRIRRYYSFDGLVESEFSYQATYRDNDGQLLFGGNRGICAFYPFSMEHKAFSLPDIFFSSLIIGDERVNPASVSSLKEIRLPSNNHSFTIGFSVPDFMNPQKLVYEYRLDNYDNLWRIANSSVRQATYTHLPSGSYTFTVRSFFENDESNFREKSITVIVPRPWYAGGFALFFYLLILAGLILYTVKFIHIKKRDEASRRDSEIKSFKLKMFTDITHEIRTPLTLVISPLKQLRETEDDPKKKDTYNLMYRNCLRTIRLINQMMDIRKIDNGMLELNFRKTDIVYFIKDIMNSFRSLAEQRHINFRMHTEMDALELWIDQGNFDKVIYNVLSNAFKHTPDNGVVELFISSSRKNDGLLAANIANYIVIDIFNSGSHISEENKERIFDRFYQESALDAGTGSGVGLNLTKMLVEKHYGTISAFNSGDGITFSISIPEGCAHLSERELQDTSHHKDLYTKSPAYNDGNDTHEDELYAVSEGIDDKIVRSRRTIVIVDDDKEIRSYLHMELKESYNIITADNGRSAWTSISTSLPDAVVTDLEMPGMDGLELCTKIKHNPNTNHIPVIVLTSHNDLASAEESAGSGADVFLTKPLSIELLSASIANVISIRDTIKGKYDHPLNYDYEDVKMKDSGNIVDKVIAVITEHLDDSEFGVDQLAMEIGMSRVHLNRKLKESINTSPSILIKSVRLKQAAYLLIKNNVNISEVAYRVGFSNPSYFSSSFHDYFGMTPKEFGLEYQGCTDEEKIKNILGKIQ